ncbi:MAG: hypothetical protein L3K04_07560, partial [Thermoplasmata archaeon]|nr:hypothetical protein [Thermoplasmata archaeon]
MSFDSAFQPGVLAGIAAPGGPWTIVAAEGLGLTSGLTGVNAGSVVGGGCTVTPAPGSPAVITVLGTPSNASAGEVAQWFFFAINASHASVLMISVTASSSAPIEVGTGSTCLSTFTSYAPINASAVLDSTAAVQDFNAEGGTAWAQNHTVLTRLFALVSAT